MVAIQDRKPSAQKSNKRMSQALKRKIVMKHFDCGQRHDKNYEVSLPRIMP